MFIKISFFLPLAIIVWVFDFAAFLAAVIFVIIPPRPNALELGPAYLPKFLSDTDIDCISSASFSFLGSLLNKPS